MLRLQVGGGREAPGIMSSSYFKRGDASEHHALWFPTVLTASTEGDLPSRRATGVCSGVVVVINKKKVHRECEP